MQSIVCSQYIAHQNARTYMWMGVDGRTWLFSLCIYERIACKVFRKISRKGIITLLCWTRTLTCLMLRISPLCKWGNSLWTHLSNSSAYSVFLLQKCWQFLKNINFESSSCFSVPEWSLKLPFSSTIDAASSKLTGAAYGSIN